LAPHTIQRLKTTMKVGDKLLEYKEYAYYCPRCDDVVISWSYLENLIDEIK